MKKFKINIDDKIIKDIRDSILKFNWGNLPNINNWDLGVNKFILKDLCDYWISKYDWKIAESELNNFNHYTEVVDDLKIHFVYEKGMSQNSIPLLISHGWPGSFLEFKNILEPLTNPKKYGLDEDVCFDLIMPSIPGLLSLMLLKDH